MHNYIHNNLNSFNKCGHWRFRRLSNTSKSQSGKVTPKSICFKVQPWSLVQVRCGRTSAFLNIVRLELIYILHIWVTRLLEYALKDQQKSSQTVEKMSHLINFQRQIFIFSFSFPGCLFLLLLFVTIRYFGIPTEFSFFHQQNEIYNHWIKVRPMLY